MKLRWILMRGLGAALVLGAVFGCRGEAPNSSA